MSRRRTWRAPVTWRRIAASVWPARSWSSRAMRFRSAATAASARASLAASSCSMRTCWRRSTRPRTKVNTQADVQGSHTSSSGATITDVIHGVAAEARRTRTARVVEPKCHEVNSTIVMQRKKVPSRLPSAIWVAATDTRTSAAKASEGNAGTRPRTTKAAMAGTRSTSSIHPPGSVTWAMTTVSTVLTTRNGSSSRRVGDSGRRRSARRRCDHDTVRGYDESRRRACPHSRVPALSPGRTEAAVATGAYAEQPPPIRIFRWVGSARRRLHRGGGRRPSPPSRRAGCGHRRRPAPPSRRR